MPHRRRVRSGTVMAEVRSERATCKGRQITEQTSRIFTDLTELAPVQNARGEWVLQKLGGNPSRGVHPFAKFACRYRSLVSCQVDKEL
ncbi:hypothetical protein TGRH88_081770 [Toxoplasma gondii]|uniref:Uncharacterized protein n=1 Tax=Toxoplasma gondii TaxID=5811 RepID=A0A7J6K6Q5_TOXGO|nr:hypothetical protein TGRH88_081770 [Toxoplasma gondii]